MSAIRITTLALLSASTLLTGCASMFTVGNSSYSCPGIPNGVRCMSARDVYAETNNRDSVEGRGDTSKKPVAEAAATSDASATAAVATSSAPSIPTIKTVPVRTAAKVMRVWIAPWEDEAGFFHGSEYVFAEVEGRKWALSDGQVFPGAKRAATAVGKASDTLQRVVTPLK